MEASDLEADDAQSESITERAMRPATSPSTKGGSTPSRARALDDSASEGEERAALAADSGRQKRRK
eukprot:3909141-Lingulodinium_polyedra.AAC.1